jgi:stress-induced morphogen
MKDIIYEKLKVLNPVFIEVRDESDKHIGHANYTGKPSHFELKIVSEVFNGMSRIAMHQEIYKILKEEMKSDIHALQIDSKALDESNE